MTHGDAAARRNGSRPASMPAVMTTTLHIGAEHVSATDLTDHHPADASDRRRDLASLTLGDHNTRVVLLGSFADLRAILAAASRGLDDVESRRHGR